MGVQAIHLGQCRYVSVFGGKIGPHVARGTILPRPRTSPSLGYLCARNPKSALIAFPLVR